jgi:hypothetical protein
MAFINQGRHIGTVGLVDPETLGGLISYYGAYKIHTFLVSAEFSLVGGLTIDIDIFAVGGGGSGGGPGGGGGGGIITHSNFSLSPGAWNIIVGGGGGGYCTSIFDVSDIATGAVVIGQGSVWTSGAHNAPTNSTFTATGVTTMVATGGGQITAAIMLLVVLVEYQELLFRKFHQ